MYPALENVTSLIIRSFKKLETLIYSKPSLNRIVNNGNHSRLTHSFSHPFHRFSDLSKGRFHSYQDSLYLLQILHSQNFTFFIFHHPFNTSFTYFDLNFRLNLKPSQISFMTHMYVTRVVLELFNPIMFASSRTFSRRSSFYEFFSSLQNRI